MSSIVINAKNVSKKFQIGKNHSNNFRDELAHIFSTRRFRKKDDHEFWALKNINFDVKKGEVIGIIGNNGAGKSTLLKILSRITRPTTGKIELTGRVASLLEIGTGFHRELTGRENIYLNGVLLGMNRKEIKHKLDEIIHFAGIEKFVETPVKHYSSGMYIRLAFSVAAFLEADILFFDEILAVGDIAFQEKSLGKINEIANTGKTIILVSHDLGAIRRMCSKGILLDKGSLSIIDNPNKVIDQYLSREKKFGSNVWRNTDSEKKWSNENIELLSFAIVDKDMKPISRVDIGGEKAGVLIEVNIKNSDPSIMIGFAISYGDGNPIFWSLHTDSPQNEWILLNLGYNKIVGWLPENLFREGRYKIETIIGFFGKIWLTIPGRTGPSLNFEMHRKEVSSPYWFEENRQGLIIPKCKFEKI